MVSQGNCESSIEVPQVWKRIASWMLTGEGTQMIDTPIGNLFLMAGGAVIWLRKKQAVVALSTSEAEYIALSLATQEAVWLRKLLAELNLPNEPLMMMENNQGAITIAKNPVAHSRTKHIDIQYQYMFVKLSKMGQSIYDIALPMKWFLFVDKATL